MNDIFLAGVANARIFKGNDLFATAKTLVDSSITIGVSAEDIRAGKGAKLYGKYFHTSTFDLKMTDAMFKLEYIQANIGAEMQLGGDVFTEIECKASEIASKITDAKPMISGSETIYVYLKKTNEDKWETYTVEEASALTGDDMYCVQFLNTNDNARKIIVNANFTPDTLSVYLDADLFAGDSMNPTTGTKVGTVTIKIPRFLLSGSQEIAMNMTGAAQTPFEGSALASNAEGCEGNGIYAEIVEVNTNFNWKNYVVKIMVDGGIEALRAASDVSELNIYALMGGFYAPKKMNSDEFEILTSVDNEVLLIDNGRYLLSENSILLQHKENANWNYGQIVIVPESQTVSSVGDNPIYLSAIDNPITQVSDIEMGVCKTRGSTIWASSFNSEINDNIIYDLENIDTIYTCQNATILNNNTTSLNFVSGGQDGVSLDNNIGTFYQSTIKNKTRILCEETVPYLFNETNFDFDPVVTAISVSRNTFVKNNFNSIKFTNTIDNMGDSVFSECENLTLIRLENNVESLEGSPWGAEYATVLWELPNYIVNVNYNSNEYKLTIEGDGSSHCVLSREIVEGIDTRETWQSVDLINIVDIGEFAFYNCTNLTSVIIGNNVTSIEESAFYGCSGLTSIEIPDSIIHIGNSAFSGCSGLTSVTIPDSVDTIGDYAFYGCSGLTSITIPDSVTYIGISAFDNTAYYNDDNNWENNTVLYINNCLIKVRNSISGSYNLKVKTRLLAKAAFYGCSDLMEVTIPDSVKYIGDFAFYECIGIRKVYISDIKEWCEIEFGENSNPLIYAHDLYINNNLVTEVTIPNSETSIRAFVFEGCSSLTSVTIPNSVTSIGDYAFYGCSGLTSVTIPNSVTSIGGGVFANCSNLESIEIPDSVTYIGDSAFADCSALTSIEIPNNITNIQSFTFNGCESLVSIEIPDSITHIGDSAFADCSSLTSIEIPDSITHIGDSAFADCSSLTSIEISNRVTSIGESICAGCSNLISVEFPMRNNVLGYLFGDNEYENSYLANGYYIPNSLTTVVINSITSIKSFAFSSCSSLTSITIPNTVISIETKAFYNCINLTSITIPDSVTSIGESAFGGCSGLTSVTFESPSGVTIIHGSAFNGCSSLTSVTIPNSVTYIAYSVFFGCSELTEIIIDNVENAISGSPWGATNATIIWLR